MRPMTGGRTRAGQESPPVLGKTTSANSSESKVNIALRKPDSEEIIFGKVTRTIELARRLVDEVIDCEHGKGSCRCGDRSAYSQEELAAFELVYRCADMFAESPYPVSIVEGLTLPPRQFAALGSSAAGITGKIAS